MDAPALFPPIEPYATDWLQVSDLHRIHYEEAGNPEGQPALFLHGGPGVGISPGYRRFFDPAHYRTILPDQRGAGRSRPHAELRENTTWDLVADLEALRKHLGIARWLVMGGSWGSTLAVSYAITHPESVAGVIIRGIFLGRPQEIRWLHEQGASEIYPDEWERYQAPIEEDRADGTVAAYRRLLTGDDEEARRNAAKAWSRWQGATMTLFPDPEALAGMTNDQTALANARIENHFTYHGFFMETENQLLERAGRMADIPCRIVQGRYDVICPMVSAWELAKALPKAELRIVPDGAHSPMDPGMAREMVQGAEDFKGLE